MGLQQSILKDALKYLSELRDKGIIKHVGLTNFDTERMQIMVDSDIQIVSNQVQYSIIDPRPEVKMIPFCLKYNISILAYGSVCGGLVSEIFGKDTTTIYCGIRYIKLKKIHADDRCVGRVGFVSRTFDNFEQNSTKV